MDTTWKVIPSFKSRDILATVKFYTEELHFQLGGLYTHGDDEAEARSDSDQSPSSPISPPTFCSMYAGDKAAVNIYHFLVLDEDDDKFVPGSVLIAMGGTGGGHEGSDDNGRMLKRLDEYYEELVGRGRVEVTEAIGNKPWGYRQFGVKDGDGNQLTFFRFLEDGEVQGDKV